MPLGSGGQPPPPWPCPSAPASLPPTWQSAGSWKGSRRPTLRRINALSAKTSTLWCVGVSVKLTERIPWPHISWDSLRCYERGDVPAKRPTEVHGTSEPRSSEARAGGRRSLPKASAGAGVQRRQRHAALPVSVLPASLLTKIFSPPCHGVLPFQSRRGHQQKEGNSEQNPE